MIVIDASSFSKYILREENWQQIKNTIDGSEPIGSIDYVLVEVTNAIRTENLKRNISESESFLRFEAMEMIYEGAFHIESSKTYIKEALKLGIAERTTIYDALYIAQALRYGKLLTSDQKQSKISAKLGIETIFIK